MEGKFKMKLVEVIFRGRESFTKSSAKELRGFFGNFFSEIIEFHNHLDQITFNYKTPKNPLSSLAELLANLSLPLNITSTSFILSFPSIKVTLY